MAIYSQLPESRNAAGANVDRNRFATGHHAFVRKLHLLLGSALLAGLLAATTSAFALSTKIQSPGSGGSLKGGTIQPPPDDGKPPAFRH